MTTTNARPGFKQTGFGLAVELHAHYVYFGPTSAEFRAGQARNAALQRSSAARTLFLDGDCVPEADVVAGHKDYLGKPVVVCGARKHVSEAQVPQLTRKSVYGGLAGHVVARDARYEQRGGPYTKFRRRLLDGEENQEFFSHRLAWGFQMSVPTKLTQSLGGFNEDFVGYGGEDQELAARLNRAGCKLVARMDLIAYHLDHPRRSGDWLSRVAESAANPDPVRNRTETKHVATTHDGPHSGGAKASHDQPVIPSQ